MITRRRRLGSETEHQGSADSDSSNQVLKGPSSVLLGSGNSFHQPSFFIVPALGTGSQIPSASSSSSFPLPDVQSKPFDSAAMPVTGSSNVPLLSTSNASSRDRTQEFFSAVRSCQSRQHNGMVNLNNSQPTRRPEQSRQQYSEFMKAAKELYTDLNVTYARLEQLTDLARKQSICDDNRALIEDLTRIIREDITILNKKIGQLQSFMRKQQDQKQSTKHHSTNVVVSLQSKLATMSSEFKQVLNVRMENMKMQQSRREKYVAGDPVVSDLPPAALMGGPYGSSSLGASGSVLFRDAQTHSGDSVAIDIGAGDHAPRRTQTQMQISADETESYLRSRSDAVQSIESTVVELGGIFQQLALMVREQEEMVQRIDSNVEDAHMNVEAAHDELLRYFRSVTNNRWLMFKIFGVVIVFIIIFAVFFA